MVTISIEHDIGVPVYRQVARQIREAIALGDLEPGRRLPSVRTLASDLGVNLNTVARAYRALEREGFVSIAGRSKVVVAAPRVVEAGRAASPPADLLVALRANLARLRQSGITLRQLRRIVSKEIDSIAIPSRED